jgi:hypothetical protein
MSSVESTPRAKDSGSVSGGMEGRDALRWQFDWRCEKWSEEAVDFVRKSLEKQGTSHIQDGNEYVNGIAVPRMIPIEHGITSEILRRYVQPEAVEEIPGNLLLNEGIQRLEDLLIAAGGTAFNNANAFIGVGDTATAEAASQTELLATQNAANRFYKAMVASYPQRPGSNGAQSVDWRSDFTSTEANFAWQEWTIAAGATTASGSGFLVGTINLNRKVQSLGTKTTGTWTMTGTVTIS